MEKPTLDPEEWIFSLSDVKQLYISMWGRLVKWALLGGIFTFLFFGYLGAPKYKAEGSFKEGIEKTSPDSMIKELMGGMASHQPQAGSFMKSHQVLRPLVEKMGLQILSSEKKWFIPKTINRFRETLKAEKGAMLEDLDPFLFQDVVYERETPFHCTVSFTDPRHYTIYSKDKKMEIGKGVIGSEARLPDSSVRFTMAKAPEKLKIGAFYPLRIVHWASISNAIRSEIKIKVDKENPEIINISFCDRDRELATRIVNELMIQYQLYLKREYDHIAKEQLVYLEGKQEQNFGKMEQLFDQYTAYFNKNLKENGFVGLENEDKTLLAPHQEMNDHLWSIEVELSRIDQMEKEGKIAGIAEDSVFSEGLNQTCKKIQNLQQQRDLLELSLCQVTEHALEERREELKDVRTQRYAVEKMIHDIDLGQEVCSFDLDQGLVAWARAIRDPEEREDFAEYLENYSRLLSMREKMLQERFFYGNTTPPELEGIDLSSAQNLFVVYNSKLDAAEASMRHYTQLKNEISRPNFDLASLGSILTDPLCQKVIEEASELGLRLKDEKHHSTKEGERWEEAIALNRKVLADHLDQLYKVEELNAGLIREKMAGLQKVSLDCINRQISVLHEQNNDAIKQRRQTLLLEKALLTEKIGGLRSSLAKILPEKWRFEQCLTLKKELISKVMETLTEVVESKTISTHLHHVESKPLDFALIPSIPQSPKLRQTTFVGAFAFPFLIFSIALIRKLIKGFPTSLEKLKALKLPVLGSISAFCDGPSVETPTGPDLDLLRRLALFAEGGKVIGLIGGRGPDYSYALAENLARMSTKSIILRCDFLSKFRKEDTPGLLQVWKGESGELPIRKGKGFDYITAGGYSPFGPEIIQSQSFAHLVDLLKNNYDWVFLLFRTPLSSAESIAALRLCEKAIVTVSGEQTEELTPFVNWAYHEDRCRLTFITRS